MSNYILEIEELEINGTTFTGEALIDFPITNFGYDLGDWEIDSLSHVEHKYVREVGKLIGKWEKKTIAFDAKSTGWHKALFDQIEASIRADNSIMETIQEQELKVYNQAA